ncbi:MAG: efflux RND transporter periplasmic adaptor subunit [Planctomycetes bacterium]|nr:efflux RND transporter periplasmic adaptor subunit [Planctomycetota bacterium]
MRTRFQPSHAALAAVLALTPLAAGCGPSAKAGPTGGPPPAPLVTVAAADARELAETADFTGRLGAVDDVEVRPRVSGHLEAVHFESGQLVERGDVLFTIDARWYQAALAAAEAAVTQAKVRAESADREAARSEQLLAARAISAEEAESRAARQAEARAALLSAEAARDVARLDVEFTRVTAPVDGRVSRAFVTPGNFVSGVPGANALLTTIVSVDPIHAYVDLDENTLLRMQELLAARALPADEQGRVRVEVGLADEPGFPRAGVIESFGNRLDPATGSILMRILLENPDGELVPGLFARVRVPVSARKPTVLVEARAIGTDQSQKFVYVVGPDGIAQYRPVQLGPVVEGLRVVRAGLEPGERVVVNGLQRVRPGAPVTAEAPHDATQTR